MMNEYVFLLRYFFRAPERPKSLFPSNNYPLNDFYYIETLLIVKMKGKEREQRASDVFLYSARDR